MSKLPMDLIGDIFSRLPPKSLLRFKCLSKICCALIDAPDFVFAHLDRSRRAKSHLNLILKSLHLYSLDLDVLDSAVPLDNPFFVGGGTEAFGSCNGLIALRNSEKSIALYNPSTRVLCKLPTSPIDLPEDNCKPGYVFYGFGQDVKTGDYKVVRMVQFNKSGEDDDEGYFFDYEVKVYSLKDNAWRMINERPRYLRFMFQFFYHLLHRRGYGVLAYGTIHWVMPPRIELGIGAKIVGFDLGTERFIEVPQPTYGDEDMMLDVGVLDGRLCVTCNYSQACVDLWVMKEYRVKDSWSRLLSLQNIKIVSLFSFVKPLMYSKEGDKVLLEVNNRKIVWYDLKTKRMRSVKIHGAPDNFSSEIYVGSLIPLNEQKEIDGNNQEKNLKKRIGRNGKKRDDFLSEGFKLVL